MSITLIIFIALQILAFAYFLEVIRRIRQRVKEYPLEDSSETLPFGFVRLRHVIFIYIVLYLFWVLLSFWLYFIWVNVGNASLPTPVETLNL